ncbi:hypothetical protein [Nocardioides nitrophenolicus]|uniref:hypothetical protein n=1 Tax=Nocardioides nitrophenolicus TaxID=60489 RepID=UPI000AC1FDA5|nr:hypothetical protein [Nocardioides nitrophenolicus]MBM7518629.1 hypothetical protein [Nocardioides nitrophenolicus]
MDWDGIRPLRSNQRVADAGVSDDVKQAQHRFNDAYCTLLWMLEQAFNGDPSMLGTATKAMLGLKAQAQELMTMPLGDGTYAAPTFEYVAPDLRV